MKLKEKIVKSIAWIIGLNVIELVILIPVIIIGIVYYYVNGIIDPIEITEKIQTPIIILFGIIIAPIIEEYIRRKTIKKGFGYSFSLTLGIIELILWTCYEIYVSSPISGVISIMVLRLIWVKLHLWLCETNEKEGLKKAMMYHMLFNIAGLIFENVFLI